MATSVRSDPTSPAAALRRRRGSWRPGDALLYVVTLAAALVGVVLLVLIGRDLLDSAWPAMKEFGLGFFTDTTWNPTTDVYGAGPFIFGTALSSFGALLLATPISLAIALFLTELAPGLLRGPVATLVELLAAIPSVVLGLWGILVMGPWIVSTLGPFLNSILGWTPFFQGEPSTGSNMLAAILILTIMIVPIVTSICTELFRQVPSDLKEGALALGATRWEVVRGVVLPYARAGIAAALILGLGRAIGEAIAVTQVIGNQTNVSWNLFDPGDTLASRIAAQYIGAVTNLQISALVYLALILLVFSLITNVLALAISRRVARRQQGRT
jgi:phosphate transport system permease protein